MVLQRDPEIPGALLDALTALQDGHVLRPAQLQGQFQKLRVVCIGPVELPHPAQVPGGKAFDCGVVCLEIFSGHDRRALLRAATDNSADLEVQHHLGELRHHELIQRLKHSVVISWFSDVHWLLLSRATRHF